MKLINLNESQSLTESSVMRNGRKVGETDLPASWTRHFRNIIWKVDTVLLKFIIRIRGNNEHRNFPVCNFNIEDNLMTEGRIVTRDQEA